MVMMRMRSDDDTFSAGQISPPDSTGGSDWAVRQLSAEIKEREKRLMRLQFCSSTGTPAAAPTTSQNNPRARKQPGTGAKHQPMTSHQFPQPPTPLSSNPSPQCRVQPPAVHQHVPPAVPRASRRAETFPRLPHRRVDPTSSGRPACTRPGPAIGRSPVLSSVMIPLIIFIFFYLPAIDCILSRQDFFFFCIRSRPTSTHTLMRHNTLNPQKSQEHLNLLCCPPRLLPATT